MITCHLLRKTLSFLFKSKDETDEPTTTIEESSYTKERESIMAHHQGRVDGKGGKKKRKKKENQFPRSGQLDGIHRDTTFPWPRKSGISKERRICVQKTDGFHPVATLLSIQPPPPPRFFFTLNRFFYATSPLFPSFPPFFFSLLPFFFIESKTNPWNFRRNPSEYAGYASSASPLWFHPSAARWSPEIRKKFTCFYPRHFAITRLSLSLSVSCGLKRVV